MSTTAPKVETKLVKSPDTKTQDGGKHPIPIFHPNILENATNALENKQALEGDATGEGFGMANGRAKDNPFDLNDSDSEDDHLDQDRFDGLIYFNDQFHDAGFQQDCGHVHKYHKFQHGFNLWYFLEAFVLHFVYQTWLGPFIYVVAFLYWPYFKLFGNMRFLYGGAGFWITLIYWLINLTVLYCHFDREYAAISFNFVMMMYFTSAIRAANIAAKYATFTKDYRTRLLNRYVSDEEMAKFFLMASWDKQNNHVVKRELQYAIRRKMIDVTTFKVSFIDPPSETIANALNDTEVIGDYCQGHASYKVPNQEAYVQYYDCRSILYNLLAMHTKYRTNWYVGPLAILLSLVWFCLPGLSRLIVGTNYCGYEWKEIVVFFVTSLMMGFVFFFSFAFFRRAYFDYDRIDFGLKQLWQMLSPTKVPTVQNKVFPTINLSDPISLQSWLNMRRVVLNYGIGFHSRHKIFIPVCFTAACVAFANVSSKRFFMEDQPEFVITMCNIASIFVIVVYGGFYVALIRKCKLINDSYKQHLCQLRDNQQIYQSMHHFRDYYIRNNKDKEIPYDVNQIFNTAPRSVAHRQLTEWMATTMGDEAKFEQFCDPLVEKLVEMMNEFSKELDREYEYHAKTFLGRRVTYAIMGLAFGLWIFGMVSSYLTGIENRRPINLSNLTTTSS